MNCPRCNANLDYTLKHTCAPRRTGIMFQTAVVVVVLYVALAALGGWLACECGANETYEEK